jgi:hypothetical protein
MVRCVDKISKSLPKEGTPDENYKEMLDKNAKKLDKFRFAVLIDVYTNGVLIGEVEPTQPPSNSVQSPPLSQKSQEWHHPAIAGVSKSDRSEQPEQQRGAVSDDQCKDKFYQEQTYFL